MLKIYLQRFAEEAAEPVADIKEETVANVETDPVAEEIPSVEGGSTENGTEPGESFDDLIKGRFQEEYSKRVEKAVKDRLKSARKDIRERDTILKLVGEKYKWDGKDLNALKASLEGDDSLYEDEAIERGMSIDTLKYIKGLERANAAREEEAAINQQEAEMKATIEAWVREEKEVQKQYPDFNLREEMKNPDFRKFMSYEGLSMVNAYEIVNRDRLRAQVEKTVAQDVVQNITSRANRPTENAAKPRASADVKRNISNLSMAEMDDMIKRAGRGERITLK